MSAKITTRRRAKFLHFLAASGNVSLSAERAKVSRSWVGLHRAGDPAFEAACVAALGVARTRFRKPPPSPTFHRPQGDDGAFQSASPLTPPSSGKGIVSNHPPTGWGFLDGAELVVRGSGGSGGGRRVQIGRARVGQWTARVERRFLSALSATCNVKAACAEVGLAHSSAYAHRQRWIAFAEAWDAAIKEGYMRIEAALIERGCNIFSSLDEMPLSPIPTMSAADAIHLLHMHKNIAHGIGGRPGKSWQRPRSLDEVRDSILRKLEAIESSRALSETQRAADEREYRRRRG